MSRSIHKTLKSVFHRKSVAEVDDMVNADAPDPDVIELRNKARIKKEVREQRKFEKLARAQDKTREGR